MRNQAMQGLLGALRTLLGLGLLGFLIYRLDPRSVLDSLRNVTAWGLLLAILTQLLAKLIWTSRWKAILQTVGLRKRFSELIQILLIGVYFNSFLPTAVGGDLVRGYYAGKESGEMSMSYASILAERAIGLVSLACMASIASLLALLIDYPFPSGSLLSVALAGALLTAAGFLAFGWSGWHRLVGRIPIVGGKLRSLAQAVSIFDRPGSRTAWILATSIGLQFVAVLFYAACARAVRLETPILFFFILVPISVIVSMIPVTFNGLGIREGVLVSLMVQQGATPSDAGAFALLALLISSLFGLLGGLLYLSRRSPSESTLDSDPSFTAKR